MDKMKKWIFLIVFGCVTLSMTACSPEKVFDKVLSRTDKREEADPKDTVEKVKIDVVKPEITANLEGMVSYAVGQEAAPITVAATISDTGTLSYQWYRNMTNANGGGTKIEGAVTDTFIPPTTEEGSVYYYVVATNTIADTTNGATTGTLEVKVTIEPAAEAETEDIIKEVKVGWHQDEHGWWYGNEDGSFVKSEWKEIEGKKYCFDEKGYARLGWYQEGEDWYYFNADRSMATDIDMEGYHLGKDGKMDSDNS